jgi:AraC-like DNA-binding protein
LQVDHGHDEVEFNLVIRGSGRYLVGNAMYDLKPGALVWLLPGQRHQLIRSPQLEMWVVFGPPDAAGSDWLAAVAEQPSHILAGDDLLDLDRLLSLVAQDTDDPEAYRSGLCYAFLRARKACRNTPGAETRPLHPAIMRALLIMRQGDATISLSDLAAVAGVAAPYLSRLFIEHTGRNFVEWRNRLRLERFLDAYRPGDNLLASALSAGFGSYARFHHVFSETIGCAPSEWLDQSGHAEAARQDAVRGLAGDYGHLAATVHGVRHRWTRLMGLVSPAIKAALGDDFLARVAGTAESASVITAAPAWTLDAGVSEAERQRLISALAPQGPALAQDLANLMPAQDFAALVRDVFQAYGLEPQQFRYAIAALIGVLWVAAKRAPDPGQEAVMALAGQIESCLRSRDKRIDPRVLQDAHTALLCHFAVTYLALQAARASGDPRAPEQLADVAATCSKLAFGEDVATMDLTSRGLHHRKS